MKFNDNQGTPMEIIVNKWISMKIK